MNGIIVGCDSNQEWLLPWWYYNLRQQERDIPVAFGDLGMSEKAKEWCKKRGILIPSSQIPPHQLIYFRKPFLMKQSPFDRTLWLDLDCQVLGTLSPLFSLCLPSTKFAIRSGPNFFKMDSIEEKTKLTIKSHNSGTVLFEKESFLLDFWIFFINEAGHNFRNEDQLFSFAIYKYQVPIGEIPFKYNWLPQWGINPETAVLHWTGELRKKQLRVQIHLEREKFDEPSMLLT